jgi:thiosulfate/3-mercaptopyruvate sulfurtransferase
MSNYKGYEDSSLAISVDEARKQLGKREVIFIDTRNYWKYAKGHIPDASNLELYAFHWIDTSKAGIGAFSRQMGMLFDSLGVTERTTVIFYQNNSGYDAARGVWLLNFLGHHKAALLDGGFNLWKRKGYPTSTRDPEPRPKEMGFEVKTDNSLLATKESLLSSLESGSSQVVDVRSKGEFDSTFRRARKAGHIPKAINQEWKNALQRDGSLKTTRELRKLYTSLDPSAKTVTYCQSGYRAAHSWLVLKLLGFENVQNYLGSWYEWGNDPVTPVVEK